MTCSVKIFWLKIKLSQNELFWPRYQRYTPPPPPNKSECRCTQDKQRSLQMTLVWCQRVNGFLIGFSKEKWSRIQRETEWTIIFLCQRQERQDIPLEDMSWVFLIHSNSYSLRVLRVWTSEHVVMVSCSGNESLKCRIQIIAFIAPRWNPEWLESRDQYFGITYVL